MVKIGCLFLSQPNADPGQQKELRRNRKSPAKRAAKPSMFSREPLVRMARFGPVCSVHCCAKKACCYKDSEKLSRISIGQQRLFFSLQ